MHAIIDLITQAVLTLLGRNVPAKPAMVNGRYVLNYSRAIRALLIFGGPFFILMGVSIALEAHRRPLAGALFCAFFSLMGLCGLIEACSVRIEFDDHFIYTHSAWRKDRIIPWSDIYRVHFSHVNKWHVISTQRHGQIRVSIYLAGRDEFLRRVSSKISHEEK